MIINKIRLENFRQFYGSQEIDLSTDTKKNVTLVHAENGFGKVSSSQGNKGVLDALAPFIGAEYILFSENKEAKGNKKETKLSLHGSDYVTSLFNQPKTLTRIERIL